MQRDRSDAADRQHDSFLAPSLPKKNLWRFIIFYLGAKLMNTSINATKKYKSLAFNNFLEEQN